MARNKRAVLELLASISDGTPPDWTAVDPHESPDAARHVGALKAIADVAQLHRSMGDPADPIGPVPRFWNGFTIYEQLGEGSSGNVFRASQPTLDRDVALKLFKPAGAHGMAARTRMLAEGQALARIRHEHVVHVYGAEEAEGCVGLWMELVRGRSLQATVARQGIMAASEAALIGREVCRAVSAVHRAGLVHGDIKAQNVMREEGGRVVLMDFGSGRMREPDQPVWRTGTPLYLAPEILAGGRPTPAGDLYAIGVLLFFLTTGQYPVSGTTISDLSFAHHSGRRRYLQHLRPDCPDAFATVVDRALSSDPSDRFQSMEEMQRALAGALSRPGGGPFRFVPSLIVVVLLGLGGFGGYRAAWGVVGGPPYSSVAVIPFESTVDASQTHGFVEAMSDDITVQLSRLPGLRLVAGTSARRYRDSSAPVGQIGRDLNVAALVTGRVLLRDSTIQVFVELVDTRTSRQLWAETLVGRTDELDALQRRVAIRIASKLKGQLTQVQEQAIARKPMSSAALDLYLRGSDLARDRDPAKLPAAVEFFRQAVAVQPDAGLPQAGLANAHLFSGLYGPRQLSEAYSSSRAAALRALELDDTLAEAHNALASVYQYEWDFAAAGAEYRRALTLNPNNATAHHWYALYLVQMLQFGEALREIDYACTLDPLSSAIATARGVVLYQSRDFDGAIRQFLAVLAADPGFAPASFTIAEAYTMTGQYAEALDRLQQARVNGGRQALEAYIRAAQGDRESARRLLQQAEIRSNAPRDGEMDLAATYDLLGLPDRAGESVQRARKNHDDSLRFAAVEPRWDRLRATAAFATVAAATGLPIGEHR